MLAGLEPKSIGPATRKRDFAKVEDDCDKEWIKPPEDWNPKKKALVVVGDPGAGKTNWATAMFKKPIKVTGIEDLKEIPEGCDGLVFDNQEFADDNAKNGG